MPQKVGVDFFLNAGLHGAFFDNLADTLGRELATAYADEDVR